MSLDGRPFGEGVTVIGAARLEVRADGSVVPSRTADLPYGLDAAGTAISLRTDATGVRFEVEHLERPDLARCGVWSVLVDGRVVSRVEPPDVPRRLQIDVPLDRSVPHDVALLCPYGDAVALHRVALVGSGRILAPRPEHPVLLVALGDSVTQGFSASAPDAGWVELVRRAHGWRVLNLGFAGHLARAEDAALIDGHDPDVVTVAFGINDCLQGRTPPEYGAELGGLLDGIARRAPHARLVVLTPTSHDEALWPGLRHLQAFREQARRVAVELGAGCADGTALLPARQLARLTVADRLHPSDAGFRGMADQLAPLLVGLVRNPDPAG